MKRKKKRKKRNNRWILKIIVLIILFILSGTISFGIKKNETKKIKKEREKITENIKNNFNKNVLTKEESIIYKKDNDNYIEIGKIGKNVYINLDETLINYQTKYFKISNLDYYIEYSKVTPTEENIISDRYKVYVPFNKNVITNNPTKFYTENGDLYIEIKEEYNLPIIIYDNDKYGVEYNNRLLYVYKDDINKTIDSKNTTVTVRSNIRTLTYHTVYQKGVEECTNSAVCHPVEKFEEQIKYIHDAGYITLTLNEMEMFLDGKIRVPKNTIVITLDDGKKLHNSIPIVEKYQVNATFFIVTSRTEYKDYLDKDLQYAHFESHTDNLHHNYVCPGGYYGGEMLCTTNDKVVTDLKLSQEKLGGATYFAYPYFDFNDNGISALKKAGFKMAFIGEYNSNGYSNNKTNRYKLPRKTIFGTDGLSVLKSYLPESE